MLQILLVDQMAAAESESLRMVGKLLYASCSLRLRGGTAPAAAEPGTSGETKMELVNTLHDIGIPAGLPPAATVDRLSSRSPFSFAMPQDEDRWRERSARAAFYCLWLNEAVVTNTFEGTYGEGSTARLAYIMKMCPGCGTGTGWFCDGCNLTICQACEEAGRCPRCY